MTKKGALINDISGLGKCSLAAAVPVLSAMGVQACPVPTAVLTAQTGFEGFFHIDCTELIDRCAEGWQRLGFCPDGIYTGFLSSEKQADKILSFISAFKTKSKKIMVLVDPVLGDGGKTYSLYTPALCEKMRALVSAADVITPNLTECCLLCGEDYSELIKSADSPDFLPAVTKLGQKLAELFGIKTVIVTGVENVNSAGEAVLSNVIISGGGVTAVSGQKIGASYSGTGDLFASVVFAGLLRGDGIEKCVRLAADFIEASVRDTVKLKIDRNHGVEFERHLDMLINS